MDNKESQDYSSKFEKNSPKSAPNIPSDNNSTQNAQNRATDMKNHNRDMKSEDEYDKGANDDIGRDIRKSRQNAEDFQEENDL